MKFETRLEAKVVLPIVIFMLAQVAGAIVWGAGMQERIAKVETATDSQGEQLGRMEAKLDKINDSILDLTREMSR